MSLQIVFLLYLLDSASSLSTGTKHSLWGKMADFSGGCSHWRLRTEVSIPALKEVTACMHVQLKENTSPLWTAFTYRSAEGQGAELGLGGKHGHIVVWLFGQEWTTTSPVQLQADHWRYLCLTWSQTATVPTLYVDSAVVQLRPVMVGQTPVRSSSQSQIAPNGTLTLGYDSRFWFHGVIQAVPAAVQGVPTAVQGVPAAVQGVPRCGPVGRLSLFRVWSRERSAQEVTSQGCVEGDLVRWEEEAWDSPTCAGRPETFLPCEWSVYEVRLSFLILRDDRTTPDRYQARDIAHCWLRDVLAPTIYLHLVSVSQMPRLVSDDSSEKSNGDHNHNPPQQRWAGDLTRFRCLAHLNVIPCRDVAAVQRNVFDLLSAKYNKPGVLVIHPDQRSIYTTPIDAFSCSSGAPILPVTNSSVTTTSTLKTTTSTPISTPTTAGPTNTFSTKPKTFSPVATSSIIDATASTASTTPVSTFNALSELYFDVQVNVSLEGAGSPEGLLHTWLRNILPSGRMMVLNLQVLVKTSVQADRHNFHLQENISVSEVVITQSQSRESCVFQVQVLTSPSSAMATEQLLRHLLESPYNSSSVSIVTQDIHISRIYIVECEALTQQTEKGLFRWPRTKAQHNATLPCPGNPQRNATQHCSHWTPPDVNQCLLVVETIPDLDHVEVTPENSMDVVALIARLLSAHSELTHEELGTVLNKLDSVVNASAVTQDLGLAVITVISEILESHTGLMHFTNLILKITEKVGDNLRGSNGSSSMLAPAMALAAVDIPDGHFSSLSFSVSSPQGALTPQIHINTLPFIGTVAFISLPSALNHSFPPPAPPGLDPPRVLFQFFGSQMLFKVPESVQRGQMLNTFVVAASVTNASRPITDLDQGVEIMLHHLVPNTLNKNVQCAYWNFNRNNGHGGWDSHGCRTHNTSLLYTTCLCDHLTHFGVLLDVSRTELDPTTEMALTIVTYVGCGLSSLFLGLTVLTYTAFQKLRRDYPSQILINLSLALLSLNLVFLLNSWLSSWGVYGLCVGVASALHYFLLASFTWMGLEAVHMYLALVKVFNVYVPSYILKFCALGWGLPLVVCLLVLVVNRDAYGSHLSTDTAGMKILHDNKDFCWIQDDSTFYVTVVGYAVMVFLFNIAVFVVVLIQIHHMRSNRPAGISGGLLRDLRGVASLTLLLGLTWTTGFFTWGPARVPMLYLFSGFNSLQGLFVFIFHCLMKENVRKQWRVHLCFGCLGLEDDSDWSHTASAGPAGRSSPPAPLGQSFRSVKSGASDGTSSTSASSEQSDPSSRRPHLALLVNALALPRAQVGTQVGGQAGGSPGPQAHQCFTPDGQRTAPSPP